MSPKVRLAIYTAVAGALAVLVVLGVVSQGQSDALLALAESILQLVTAAALVVASSKLTEDAWSSLRGALYVVTSALLAAAGLFGLVSPDWSPLILDAVDSILSVVGVAMLSTAAVKVPTYTPERLIEGEAA